MLDFRLQRGFTSVCNLKLVVFKLSSMRIIVYIYHITIYISNLKTSLIERLLVGLYITCHDKQSTIF